MVPVAGHVIVPVRFGADPRSMIVDTGADGSVLFKDAVRDEKLSIVGSASTVFSGVGGVRRADVAEVPLFDFDGFRLKALAMPVMPVDAPKFDILPVAGVLGTSILSVFDVDMDFPGQTMTLFARASCDEIAPPWSPPYSRVQLIALPNNLRERLHDDVASAANVGHRGSVSLNQAHVMVDVGVNGRTLRALLDTGSTFTSLTPEAAEAAGVRAPHNPLAIKVSGADGHAIEGDRRSLGELKIGDAVFRDVPVAVFQFQNTHTDMVIGLAELRGMRVWISFASKQMFFQPSNSKP